MTHTFGKTLQPKPGEGANIFSKNASATTIVISLIVMLVISADLIAIYAAKDYAPLVRLITNCVLAATCLIFFLVKIVTHKTADWLYIMLFVPMCGLIAWRLYEFL